MTRFRTDVLFVCIVRRNFHLQVTLALRDASGEAERAALVASAVEIFLNGLSVGTTRYPSQDLIDKAQICPGLIALRTTGSQLFRLTEAPHREVVRGPGRAFAGAETGAAIDPAKGFGEPTRQRRRPFPPSS